jgi:hypothetical protein
MKDNSALVEKSDIHLKTEEFLNTVNQSGRPVSVEWKDDGSLTIERRQWIWDHRDVLTGQIAEVRAMDASPPSISRTPLPSITHHHPHPNRTCASRSAHGSSTVTGKGDPEKVDSLRVTHGALPAF